MTGADARRAFGFRLAASALLLAGMYMLGVGYEMSRHPHDVIITFENGFAYNYLAWLTPLAAALPFAASFCADWRSGSAISQVLLAGRQRYARSKWLCAALTGGLACAGGLILFFVALLPNGHFEYYRESFGSFSNMLVPLEHGRIAAYVAGYAFLQFLLGACWSAAGLAFSAFCPNTYLALCFPMLLDRLSMELPRLSEFVPEWVNLPALAQGSLNMDYRPTLALATFVFGALTALCGLVFAAGVKRRLEHG